MHLTPGDEQLVLCWDQQEPDGRVGAWRFRGAPVHNDLAQGFQRCNLQPHQIPFAGSRTGGARQADPRQLDARQQQVHQQLQLRGKVQGALRGPKPEMQGPAFMQLPKMPPGTPSYHSASHAAISPLQA